MGLGDPLQKRSKPRTKEALHNRDIICIGILELRVVEETKYLAFQRLYFCEYVGVVFYG